MFSSTSETNPVRGKVDEMNISLAARENGVSGENEINGTNQFGK
tara:strand:+ start:720 stop:851 length:132 start_codon:yes stop_codon:yes gene_type:complete